MPTECLQLEDFADLKENNNNKTLRGSASKGARGESERKEGARLLGASAPGWHSGS